LDKSNKTVATGEEEEAHKLSEFPPLLNDPQANQVLLRNCSFFIATLYCAVLTSS
jgi:hypothetical protein